MRAMNAATMRLANRIMLLNRIRMSPISRAELADETGLTRASVTQIMEELIAEDLVKETTIVERARLGRRSTQLAINADAGYLFGLTLGAKQCILGAADLLGKVKNRSIEVVDGRAPEEVLDAIAKLVLDQMKAKGIEAERVVGFGVSVPGAVDPESGCMLNPAGMELWKGIEIRHELETRTGLKVYVESAVNAQTLEHFYFGKGGNRHFALVSLENTLSAGVMAQDMLYRGAPNFEVDLGQCPADCEGKRTLNDLIADADWRQLLANAESPECDQMLARLAYPMANAMCVYRVNEVVLGGETGVKLGGLLPKLEQHVKRMVPEMFRDCVKVKIADTEPVRMAVAVAYRRMFSFE